jgi:hypothetical protein
VNPVGSENVQHDVSSDMDIVSILKTRNVLLEPFVIDRVELLPSHTRHDALIDARWRKLPVQFLARITARGSRRAVRDFVDQCRVRISNNTHVLPIIVAPYLSEAALDILESEGVCGVDLCGNGVIIEHERFLVRRSGFPNRYPDNTPIRDLYRGQAGLVVRALIACERWSSLSQLHTHITSSGTPVSLSLCSKVVSTLNEDELAIKDRGELRATGFDRILGHLEHAWDRVRLPPPISFAVSGDPMTLLAQRLHGQSRWVVSGASSVGRYATLAQGGPIRVLVDDVKAVAALLEARHEAIPAFAAIQLQECTEPGAYYGTVEHEAVRWASPLQTWLELRTGDARQREAANDVYRKIREQHG